MHTYVAFLHIRSTGQRWFALCCLRRWSEAVALTGTCHDCPGGQDEPIEADRNAVRQSSGLTIERPVRRGRGCCAWLASNHSEHVSLVEQSQQANHAHLG